MRETIFSLVFLSSVLVAFIHVSEAAVITAASCSRADVGAAVASATHGDTVRIPPGDCSWTTQLNVDVGITLTGAGQGVTTIRDNVPKNGTPSSSLMSFSVLAPNNFRITGFTLVGEATDSSIYNQGHIKLSGTAKAFRVDHITVSPPQTSVVRTFGYLWGVIDHVTVNGNKSILVAGHGEWGGSRYGDGSWAEQLYLGTEKAIYVEDCVLTANSNPIVANFTDGLDGARVVIRYNKFTQGNTGAHGADSGQRRRGIRSQEIYNNTFTFPPGMAVDSLAWFRGGTGVMFNNTVIADWVNSMAKKQNLRDNGSYIPWGQCNGTSPYDLNQAGQSGYRCVDQPGAGTSNHLNGVDNLPAQSVGNALDPIYVWNNTVNGRPNNGGDASIHVQAGRDFIEGVPRPGYTPFTYPHPLVNGQSVVPAPTRLQVR